LNYTRKRGFSFIVQPYGFSSVEFSDSKKQNKKLRLIPNAPFLKDVV